MLILTYYNQSVCLKTDNYNLLSKINNFLDRFYTSKNKSFNNKAPIEVKLYASKIKDQGIFFLHTNQFIHLCHEFKKTGIKLKPDEKIDKREYKIDYANMEVRSNWELRDYQKPIVEFLLNNPVKSKLVPLQTGSGKTVLSLYAIAQLKQRMGMVIPSMFLEKWAQDILNIHNTKPENIMVIQGYKSLRSIIELAKSESLDNNYYLFSNRTLQEYITQYEENPELCIEMYGCSPIELFPLLGIGVLLIDESHMLFHSLFKIILHINVKYIIGLTATLLSDDYIVRRVHKILYPEHSIYKDSGLVKYIDVYAVNYTIPPHLIKLFRTTNYGSSNYSHIAFEQSILRRNNLLDRYIKIIDATINDYFIEDFKEKDKLLIFVSTISLATILTNKLKNLYSDFIVKRYCEEDPYENLMTSDIIVSTVLSSGTGVDIPHLRVIIQTVSISSQVSNIQSLGRLRCLPNRDVKFCYLYSSNISKQKEYHMKRVELFTPRVANISYRQSRLNFS